MSDVRLNPKNFAFVVFGSPEPVDKIIAASAKDRFQLKGKYLNIEPKRSGGGRGPGGYRGDRNKPFGGGGGMGGGKQRSGGGGMGGGGGGGTGGGGSGKGPKR